MWSFETRSIPITAEIYFIHERPSCVLVQQHREDEIRTWLKKHAIERFDTWQVGSSYNWTGADGNHYFLEWPLLDGYVMFEFARIEDVIFFKLGYG